MVFIVISWTIAVFTGGVVVYLILDHASKSGVVVALLGIILCIGSCSVGLNGLAIPTGDGEHTGYVTAVETAGLIWKGRRAYVKTDTQSSQEDAYCVLDGAVFSQLQAFAEAKTHVRIYHASQLLFPAMRCSNESAAIVRAIPVTP